MGMIVRCMLENAIQGGGNVVLELCMGMIVRCMLENAIQHDGSVGLKLCMGMIARLMLETRYNVTAARVWSCVWA